MLRKHFTRHVVLFAAIILSVWAGRNYLFIPNGELQANHELFMYVYRLIDFRDAIFSGNLFPEWSTYIHRGFGGPYYTFYQPGFFYLASLMPSGSPTKALALAVLVSSIIGFLGMYRLMGSRFGKASGIVAATALLFSAYAGTEIFIRGDLSEYLGMMLLPWLFHHLLNKRYEASTLVFAALTIVHPLVAFIACIMLGGFFLFTVASGRDRKQALSHAWPLACGALIAAFFWFPHVFELNLVKSDRAFEGHYQYQNHFVPLTAIFSVYDPQQKTIPMSLGLALLSLATLGLVASFVLRANLSPRQKSFLKLIVCFLIASVFLMSKFSSPIWAALPLLRKLQFPWRIFTLCTVLLAAMAGLIPSFIRDDRAKLGAMLASAVLLIASGSSYLVSHGTLKVELPATPKDLVNLPYNPDLMAEWHPRDAVIFDLKNLPTHPVSTKGCVVTNFERSRNALAAQVDASALEKECTVVLPHYFFEKGWNAALNDKQIAIEQVSGLMSIAIPGGAKGNLKLSFEGTPARNWGLLVSLLTFLALGAFRIARFGRANQ